MPDTDVYAQLADTVEQERHIAKHAALGMAYKPPQLATSYVAPHMRGETPTSLAALVAQQTADAAKELEHVKNKWNGAEARNNQLEHRLNELQAELQGERLKREAIMRDYARVLAVVRTMRAATDELLKIESDTIAETR